MDFNYDSKEIRFSVGDEQYKLHPLWMRERSLEEGTVDQNSLQRLYDLSLIHISEPTRPY